MKQYKKATGSRRKTPWTDSSNATGLQKFIDRHNQENYYDKHPLVRESDEWEFLNLMEAERCPYCGKEDISHFGYTASRIRRFRCGSCHRTFTVLTGTVFDSHKIPISEWIEFCLAIFREQSFTSTSKTNKNSYTTTRYWIEKLIMAVSGIQDGIILHGTVYIDETYIARIKRDLERKEDGSLERGLGRNQICIGIGKDSEHVICFAEGVAKPSAVRTVATFQDHIEHGSHLIHDGDKSHVRLIRELGLTDEAYTTYYTSQLDDKDNPLDPINSECASLKRFLRSHSGFSRDSLQGLLDLYAFIRNPPHDPFEKIEILLKRALGLHAVLRFRDFYGK